MITFLLTQMELLNTVNVIVVNVGHVMLLKKILIGEHYVWKKDFQLELKLNDIFVVIVGKNLKQSLEDSMVNFVIFPKVSKINWLLPVKMVGCL